jgi:multidrug efflux pump subunit AcrB
MNPSETPPGGAGLPSRKTVHAPSSRSSASYDFEPRRRGLISLFVRHRNAANLLMVLMILGGIAAITRINTQVFPSIEINSVTVTINWPGASAEDVAENILANVEPSLRFIEGVEDMTSNAREGAASIRLELEPGTDMQDTQDKVEQALNAISTLPDEAETPKLSVPRFFDNLGRISISGPFPESSLKIYAKRIRDDLLELGLDKVNFSGFRDSEIGVKLDKTSLRRVDLTVSDVATAVQANSRDRPSGTLDSDVERQLRVVSEDMNAEALRNLPLRATPDGQTIRLGDIGQVVQGFNPDQSRGLSNGQTAIQMTVQTGKGKDTLESAAILQTYLEELRPTLPRELNLQLYDLRSERLNERIMLLVKNGASGLALVLIILFIFLNARTAFWVAVGIPVAMLITIGVLYVLGETINMLSLFALIMMLGIIVDDAIVVAEHTQTRFKAGEPPMLAAENGAGRMLTPVLAAALTTIASFAPILLMGGTIGAFMGVLPIVVIAVLIASLIECFLILPGHLAHAMTSSGTRRWSHWRMIFLSLSLLSLLTIANTLPLPGGFGAVQTRLENWPPMAIAAIFAFASLMVAALIEALIQQLARPNASGRPGLGARLRNAIDSSFDWFRDGPFALMAEAAYAGRYMTIAFTIAAMIFSLAFVQSGKVNFTFFPSPEAESIRAGVEFNAGIAEEDAIEKLRILEEALFTVEKDLAAPGALIRSSYLTLGSSGRSRGDNVASFRIQLTASEERDVRTSEIISKWRASVPDMPGLKRFSISRNRSGPPGRDIDVRLKGSDPGTLKQAAAELIVFINSFPGVSGAEDDLPYGKPELVMRLKDRGASLGFTVDRVGQQIRNAFEGTIARRFSDGEEEIAIRISEDRATQGSSALRNLDLRAPDGRYVPLSEVVSLSEQQGFAAIQRRDGRTTISVTADVDDKVTNANAILEQLEVSGLEEITTRYGLDYRLSGRAEEQGRSFGELRLGTAIAMMVIYIILAWVFASYTRPFVVMMIIPFGFVGTVFGHWILGFDLTVLSVIGLLGLSGILVNDSIILVSRLEERLAGGDTPRAAATGASRDRLRAVLLTSLSTIGGLAPLLFETSRQAQFLMPMAITMVFGLAFATLLVLFLVPALIGVGEDFRRLRQSIYGRPGAQSV